MIVTYLRSSSVGTYEFCPHRYYLSYILGFPDGVNAKAVLGEIVHKVMEYLAVIKMVYQGIKSQEDLDSLQINLTNDIVDLTKKSFDIYKNRYPELKFGINEYETCLNWVYKILEYKNGSFDPRNRDIVAVEYFFDVEVDKPWASYEFDLPNGEKISGQLRIKGTVDLITRFNDEIYEIVDWKTGKRLNWGTGEVKDYKYLQKDKQLLLYYYALSKQFPLIDSMLMTIVFINDGGATTIAFNRNDLDRIELMLKSEFEKIKKDINPIQNITWKCNKFCPYSKAIAVSGKTSLCQFMKQEINTIGMDKCNEKYIQDSNRITSYGAGGGQQSR